MKIKDQIRIEDDEIEMFYNNPKTYAVVYEGTNQVVKWRGRSLYFRSLAGARQLMPKIEHVFFNEKIELIQVRLSRTERMNLVKKYEIKQELEERDKVTQKRRKSLEITKTKKKRYSVKTHKAKKEETK